MKILHIPIYIGTATKSPCAPNFLFVAQYETTFGEQDVEEELCEEDDKVCGSAKVCSIHPIHVRKHIPLYFVTVGFIDIIPVRPTQCEHYRLY